MSWCLVVSLKKWQQLLGLQGHVFKAEHINQSLSMCSSNPSSQKEGKKGIFLVLFAGFIFLSKIIWHLIHYLPTGISSKVMEVSLQQNKVGHTAGTMYTAFLPMTHLLSCHFD